MTNDVVTEKETGSVADTSLSDRSVSYLRTLIPIVWGSVVTWLASTAPSVTDFLENLNINLTSETTVGIVTAAAIALWYVVWRAIEPKIPNWLTALVLGSSKQPAYIGTPGQPVVEYDEPVVDDHAPEDTEPEVDTDPDL